jgi:hypothetical protein
MSIRNRTESKLLHPRSAGVSPATKNAGEMPALRFARRVIPWLAALGLAFAWCPWAMAQEKPAKAVAKQPKAPNQSKQPKAEAQQGTKTTTITVTKDESEQKDAKAGEPTAIIATIAVNDNAIGQFPATLDQALAAAMKSNPTIIVAKANVAKAEAELTSAQMEVAQKIIAAWNERGMKAHACENLQKLFKAKTVSMSDLIAAKASLEKIDANLRCLIGQLPPIALRIDAVNATLPHKPAKSIQLPHGPMVEKIRKALLTQTDLDFYEQPFSNVVDYLKTIRNIEIQLDTEALADSNITSETPITFNLKGVTLGAVLQAFDDQHENLKLVVRDYGILVTTPSRAEERGYFPVVEFVRLISEGNEPLRPLPSHRP